MGGSSWVFHQCLALKNELIFSGNVHWASTIAEPSVRGQCGVHSLTRDNGCDQGCAISVIRYASPALCGAWWRAAKSVWVGPRKVSRGQDIGAESERERELTGGGGQRQWGQSGRRRWASQNRTMFLLAGVWHWVPWRAGRGGWWQAPQGLVCHAKDWGLTQQ